MNQGVNAPKPSYEELLEQLARLERDQQQQQQRHASLLERMREKEAALVQREERHRLALAAGAMATWDWHVPSAEVTWNDEHFRMLGYEPGSIPPSYDAWAARVHPDDRAPTEKLVQANVAQGGEYRAEFRVLPSDGTVRWMEARGRTERDAEGKPLRQYGVMLDITERKRNEEVLRRYELLAGESRDIVLFVRSEDGRILEANAAALNAYGYSREEMLSLSISDLRALDTRSLTMEQMAVADARGILFETVHRRKDGSTFPVEVSSRGATMDGTRTLISVVRDFTERKRAEEALRESETLLRTFFDSPGALRGIVEVVGDDILFISVNAAAAALYGCPPEHVCGRRAVELDVPADVIQVWLERYRESQRSNQAVSFELERPTAKGQASFSVTVSFVGTGPAGHPRFAYAMYDVTDIKRAEASQRASEGLYRAIGESIDYGVWVCAQDGRNTYASESFLRLVGMTQEQCSNFGWGDVLHPDDAERTIAAWKECVRTGGHWDIEHRFRGVDGTWHPILARGVPVKNERGEIICWAGINLDISHLKQTEEELRGAKQRLESLLENSPLAVIEWSSGDYRIVRWSDEATRVFGWTAEETLGKHVNELNWIYPDDQPLVELAMGEMLSGKRPHNANQNRNTRKDGRVIHCEWYNSTLFEPSGKLSVLSLVLDVTERKLAEAALERSNLKLAEVLDSIQDDFYVLDRDWTFTFASKRFTSRFGKEPQDFIGKNLWALFPKHIGTDYEANLRAAMEGRETRRFEMGGEDTDVWYRLTASPSTEGVTVLGTEITDNKRMEAALLDVNARLVEADERKNDFLGVLSHELRNPLTPVRNSLYILARAAPGSEQASRAHAVIDRQVGHLSRLVDDLLDVTRISRGKIRLQRARVDLVDLVRRTVEDHHSLLEEREVAIELPSEALWIDGDSTRLAQVLGNLLQNAAKFTPEGGKVSVSLTQAEGRAVLEVADTGMGIDAETLKRLFEPFAQADRSLDRTRGGLGLGLALVKGMVELHGGAVSAHSDGAGNGACFTLELPVDPNRSVAHGAPPSMAVAGNSREVLIIEDNRDAADSLREALELSGHRVAVAYDGETGLAKARTLRPEVILCDIGLPGMDGYAVARACRADESLKGIVLVALSGYALPEDLHRATEAGFQGHIAKPPSVEKLQELLVSSRVHRARGGDR